MAKRHEHTPEEKAAVLAALMAGQGVMQAARQFRVPHSTVIRWREAAGITERTMSDAKRAALDDLVGEYLRELLITLSAQARASRSETWLSEQSAADFATLHGVLADKAFRILAAAEAAEPEQASADVS